MRENNRWKLWHYKATAADTLPTSLEESNKLPLGLGMIDVKGYEEIMLQAWGVGADNDTFGMNIYGWMENGPGELILASSSTGCILGAQTFTGDLLPSRDEPRLPVGATWFAVDTYGLTAPNIIGATVQANATTAPVGGHVLIPTKGFTKLMARITGLGAAGVADAIAMLWRPTQRLRESV